MPEGKKDSDTMAYIVFGIVFAEGISKEKIIRYGELYRTDGDSVAGDRNYCTE